MQAFGLARVGRDCELRNLNSGDAVTNVSLAFAWGKKGEDGKRAVVWVEGALFGKRAESLTPYLLKGQAVSVTLDDLHIETYQNRDGGEGHKLAGKISAIDFAGSPPQGNGQQSAPAPRQAPAPRPAPRAAPATSGGGFSDMDDDVPFASSSPLFDLESRLDRRMRRRSF